MSVISSKYIFVFSNSIFFHFKEISKSKREFKLYIGSIYLRWLIRYWLYDMAHIIRVLLFRTIVILVWKWGVRDCLPTHFGRLRRLTKIFFWSYGPYDMGGSSELYDFFDSIFRRKAGSDYWNGLHPIYDLMLWWQVHYELDVKVSSYLEYIFQFEVPIDLILILDTRRFGFQDVRS